MSLENLNPNPAEPPSGLSDLEAEVNEIFGFEEVAPPPASGSPAEPVVEPGVGEVKAPSPAPETPPAPEATPAAPVTGETPAPGTPPAAPAAEPAPSAAPTPPVGEEALKLQSLEATVEALQATIDGLRANPAPAAPAAPAGESGTTEELPAYSLTLPKPVADAILGEDPQQAAAGIAHMMNSLATIIHANIRKELGVREAALVGRLQQSASTVDEAEVRQKGQEEYYGAFPTHKNDNILPLVQAEARKMAAEFPNLKWGADYINALGTRVNNRIAALVSPAPAPEIVPVPPAPAPSLPSGTRGETPGSNLEGADLIEDTFS